MNVKHPRLLVSVKLVSGLYCHCGTENKKGNACLSCLPANISIFLSTLNTFFQTILSFYDLKKLGKKEKNAHNQHFSLPNNKNFDTTN